MAKRKRPRQPADRTSPSATSAPRAARTWPRPPAALGFVLLATALAYLPAMGGGLLWDDSAHVTRPELRSLAGLFRIWFDLGATQQYYPLLHSAFWLEHRLWGDAVVGYHVMNLALHGVAVCLVYAILRRLRVPGALLAAAIFALHPVHVESVAWITEQKNTLSAVFYLGALIAYVRFDESRARSRYALALLLFALGLLTKTVIATLPAALLVIFWWRRGRLSWRRDLWPLAPFFVLGAAAGLTTAWVERTLIGAEGAAFDLTLVQRGLLAGRVLGFYLGTLLWPADLVFIYPRWDVRPGVWWQWLFPLAVAAGFAGLWAIRRRWRGPLAGALFFAGTLFPALGFLNVYPFLFSFVADHFQYLASLGVIVVLASALTAAWSRVPRRWHPLKGLAGVVLLGALALLTWRQSGTYRDAMTLYQTTIERNPACWMAWNNLGIVLMDAGRSGDALEHFRRALRLKPDYAEAYNNLGTQLAALGQTREAIESYRHALRIRPTFFEAHNNLGTALAATGDLPQAIAHFEQALRSRRDAVDAHNNLGNALRRSGQLERAIAEFDEALRLRPDYAEGHNNLGIALFDAGQRERAIEEFRHALRLRRDYAEAHANLGNALALTGNLPEAIAQFRRAIELNPGLVDAHVKLANALLQSGQPAEAIEHYERALRLGADSYRLYVNLALAYAKANRAEQAVAAAEKAVTAARAAGQPAVADQAAAWLARYRAGAPSGSRGR